MTLATTASAQRRALAGRGLLALWLLLSVLGALNQTVALLVFGRRFDLLLPHLSAGYVMFVEIPRTIEIHSYVDAQGDKHSIADLVKTPAPFYKRARTEANLAMAPGLLHDICREQAASTFLIEEYKLNFHPERPYRSTTLSCDAQGLRTIAHTGPR